MLKITPDIIYHLSKNQVLVVSFLSELQFSQYLQISKNFVEVGDEVVEVKEILVLHPTPEMGTLCPAALCPATVPTDESYDSISECDLECNVQEVVARHRKK